MNTAAGLEAVPPFMLETADGLGMTGEQVWRKVRFPLAMPVILTGIKTAAVEIVASATLASKIGAGGLGDNIATVPKLLKWDKAKIDARVDELLDLVGLEPKEFRDRYPAQLSGGQQQRVGLARALAVDPKIMLMDEPFGAVDSITREKLQDELVRLHKETGKTFLLVTHDIEEAFKLGDRVIIMNEGRLRQLDTPEGIIRHPADPFVASLVSSAKAKEAFWREYL